MNKMKAFKSHMVHRSLFYLTAHLMFLTEKTDQLNKAVCVLDKAFCFTTFYVPCILIRSQACRV